MRQIAGQGKVCCRQAYEIQLLSCICPWAACTPGQLQFPAAMLQDHSAVYSAALLGSFYATLR